MYDELRAPTKVDDYTGENAVHVRTLQDNIEETRRRLVESRAHLQRIVGFIWVKDVDNKIAPDENLINVVDMDSAILNNLEMARAIANALIDIACKLGA